MALLPRLRPSLQGFIGDNRAVAAMEFAIVLPFMLALYLGSIEAGNGFAVQFKASLAASRVADLTSQYTSIDNSTMSGILGAASLVVAPYTTSDMIVTVTQVTTDSKGQGKIIWSDLLNGTPQTVGNAVTLPKALQIANTSLIWSEVTYPYKPWLGFVFTKTINVYQTSYFYPRLSTSVSRVNS
ncbi:TadE/TadG family type IV pilus assembly protein [Bradyrhizobium sp. HKCCYLS20291]|uniref:TadE/TadG family type IV pilus assembly protein n=1 Tax=Bradyrhizobium sp. HKCCYLS20291 TaxID=3420766 RepID=UPI003EB8D8AB